MLVTTRNSDNTQTTYGFDPEHTQGVYQFYNNLYKAQKIQGFAVSWASGEVMVIGVVNV